MTELVTRREVLRWAGAAGVAAAVPFGLAACEPAHRAQPGAAPDASLGDLPFTQGTDVSIGQGGWCWFQDPRLAVDPGGRLWLGSTVGGTTALNNGEVRITIVDLAKLQVVDARVLDRGAQDDHTSPSVFVVDGRVQVAWAQHRPVDYIDVAEFDGLGLRARQRIRRPASLTSPGRGMSYASAHVVGGVRWILYRGEQFSWNLLTSGDGHTWTARGLVVKPGTYGQRPYLHAASDGTQLHFVVTDGNPTEYPGTSVYAGTIGADFTIRNSSGAVVGKVGATAPVPKALTRLAAGSTGSDQAGEADDVDYWMADLQIVDDAPSVILTKRDPWPSNTNKLGHYRHQMLWARLGAIGWTVQPLAWAGGELFTNQPDYCGLGALDPTDSRRVVISTSVDPVSAQPLVSSADGEVHWELFEGWHNELVGTWTWTPITQNSTEDNLRPAVTASGPHKVMAWMRGTYHSYYNFDTRMVVRRIA
jgi:hypothetical protein